MSEDDEMTSTGLGRAHAGMRQRRLAWWFRPIGVIACAVLVVTLLPSTPTWARDEQPPAPLAGDAPVNDVPDSAYVAPEGDREMPDPLPVERPPEGSPQAEALVAVEAERAAELADIEEMFTDDGVVGQVVVSEMGAPDPDRSMQAAESMVESAEDRPAPRNAREAAVLEVGEGDTEEKAVDEPAPEEVAVEEGSTDGGVVREGLVADDVASQSDSSHIDLVPGI